MDGEAVHDPLAGQVGQPEEARGPRGKSLRGLLRERLMRAGLRPVLRGDDDLEVRDGNHRRAAAGRRQVRT